MKFLLDMGVAVRVGTWLREQGHDSVHLRDQGLQRLPNGEIFTKAISESLLADCSGVLEEGAVVVVVESRHRVRSLPVGQDIGS